MVQWKFIADWTLEIIVIMAIYVHKLPEVNMAQVFNLENLYDLSAFWYTFNHTSLFGLPKKTLENQI